MSPGDEGVAAMWVGACSDPLEVLQQEVTGLKWEETSRVCLLETKVHLAVPRIVRVCFPWPVLHHGLETWGLEMTFGSIQVKPSCEADQPERQYPDPRFQLQDPFGESQ